MSNGEEAYEKFITKRFDIVLMDVNMPIMDGVTATKKKILEWEKTQPERVHVPIIALTANAIKGDKEEYIAAGMDGYLSKPIDREELVRILSKYCCKINNTAKHTPQVKKTPDVAKKFDMTSAAETLGLDSDTYKMLIGSFFEILDESMDKLKNSIEAESPKDIFEDAHFIKGACLNLGMHEAAEILTSIEHGSKDGTVDIDSLDKLNKIFSDIQSELQG